MADNSIHFDELTISIKADTRVAISNIDRLSSQLKKLDQTAQQIDLYQLGLVKDLLTEIANIDFSRVASSMYNIAEQLRNITKLDGGQLAQLSQEMPQLDLDNFVDKIEEAQVHFKEMSNSVSSVNVGLKTFIDVDKEIADKINTFKEATQKANASANAFRSTFVSFDKEVNTLKTSIDGADASFEALGEKLAEIGLNGSQMEQVFKHLNDEKNSFTAEEIESVRQAMTSLGMSTEQVEQTIKGLKQETEKTTKSATNGLQKVALKMKSLALYRVIRMALMKIQQAFQEAIQELAKFDGNFNKSISDIRNSSKFLANSLLTMVSPLIQSLAPIISAIADTLAEINNSIGQAFSGDTFVGAVKGAEDYAESLKKVKNTQLGIDELNVVQQEQETQLFTEEDGAKSNALKDIFGSILELVKKINTVAKDFIAKIKPLIETVFKPIMEIINNVVVLVDALVGQTFESVHSSLASFVEMIGKILQVVSTIVQNLMPALVSVMNIIAPIINIVNSLLGGSFDYVSNILTILDPIIRLIGVLLTPLSAILTIISTIFYVLQGVVNTFKDLLTFKWGQIGKDWEQVGQSIKDAWEQFAKTSAKTLEYDIPQYANGGIVEDGFFFANHNELVGSFGGQTAVANNEQITQGIYEAVLQAMRESGSSGNIAVYLDSREIAKRVEEQMNNKGFKTTNGGFNYGY